jgi:hypothetical protein
LARGGDIAGVLHDLQVTALSGRFDAEEHAATNCDTVSMPRQTVGSLVHDYIKCLIAAGYRLRCGTAL